MPKSCAIKKCISSCRLGYFESIHPPNSQRILLPCHLLAVVTCLEGLLRGLVLLIFVYSTPYLDLSIMPLFGLPVYTVNHLILLLLILLVALTTVTMGL